MGVETIILVFAVIVAVGISVGIVKSLRKLHTGSGEDHDSSVGPTHPGRGA